MREWHNGAMVMLVVVMQAVVMLVLVMQAVVTLPSNHRRQGVCIAPSQRTDVHFTIVYSRLSVILAFIQWE